MEKILGIELERVWPTMKTEDRLAIVQDIANYQKDWTSVSFKNYGGLYYSKDLVSSSDNETLYTDADGVDVKDPRFSIGPSTGREFTDNGRVGVEFDKGPCKSLSY